MSEIKKAGALIFKDKKMLIVRPKENIYFLTPGGKYEVGETAEVCLRRELKEELQAEVLSFKHYKDYFFEKAANRDVPLCIDMYIVEVSGELAPASEIEEMQWLSKEDFHKKIFNVAPSFDITIPDLIKDGLL